MTTTNMNFAVLITAIPICAVTGLLSLIFSGSVSYGVLLGLITFGVAAESLSKFQTIVLGAIAIGALNVAYGAASLSQSVLIGAIAILGCFALGKTSKSDEE